MLWGQAHQSLRASWAPRGKLEHCGAPFEMLEQHGAAIYVWTYLSSSFSLWYIYIYIYIYIHLSLCIHTKLHALVFYQHIIEVLCGYSSWLACICCILLFLSVYVFLLFCMHLVWTYFIWYVFLRIVGACICRPYLLSLFVVRKRREPFLKIAGWAPERHQWGNLELI